MSDGRFAICTGCERVSRMRKKRMRVFGEEERICVREAGRSEANQGIPQHPRF